MKIYEQIVSGVIRFPAAMSPDAKSIISGLCTVDVSKRLGNIQGGASTVKNHAWFKDIDWDAIYARKTEGPIVPHLRGPADTRNFDDYEAEPMAKHAYTKEMQEKYDCHFADF